MKRILIKLIKFYQNAVSPYFPPACRFSPTCSQYAVEALDNYPAGKALYLILRRLLKCHPFHPGGYDPLIRRR